MKMTKIVTISTFAVLLSACSGQSQIEGAAAVIPAGGAPHVHNVEGHGDFTHAHQGNSTEGHGHSWNQIQKEIKGQ